MEKIVSVLDKNLRDCNDNISIYLDEIKQRMSDKEYQKFLSSLNSVEQVINFGQSNVPQSLKVLVYNIIKTFMIQQKRIEIGDNVSIKLATIAEQNKQDIDTLKEYVVNLTTLLDENKIQYPEIKPICLETSVSSKSSINKRLELLQIAREKGDISKFIDNLNKGKATKISNEMLKTAAKENNINIRIGKNEVNKVIKN